MPLAQNFLPAKRGVPDIMSLPDTFAQFVYAVSAVLRGPARHDILLYVIFHVIHRDLVYGFLPFHK